jgi:hypothetical protein
MVVHDYSPQSPSLLSKSTDVVAPASRVLRSLSVPCNLPMAAENFIKVMEETMREEEKQEGPLEADTREDTRRSREDQHGLASPSRTEGFFPLTRADSQEFFLPFDDDNVIPEEEPHHVSTVRVETAAAEDDDEEPFEQQQRPLSGRDVAVARLEEFFLGGTSFSTPPPYLEMPPNHGFSPVSTIEIDKAMSTEFTKTSKSCVSLSTNSGLGRDDSLGSVLEDDPSNGISAKRMPFSQSHNSRSPHRTFTKLTSQDRTTSLPLDFAPSSSPPVMVRRRPSLKKVSSYGQFPPIKPSSSNNTLKRNVSFGSMKIREFNIAISDNPCCSYGPPIGLSWEYQEQEEVPLETYEATREGNRRQGHSLLLSFYERHFMLIKQGGYSKKEIKETMKEVERVKRDRMVTDLFLPASPLDETMEHVMDTVKKFFRRPQNGASPHATTTRRAEAV